ncbi:MAG: hypothetical protein BJ554DRAFT_346 [Olpidium bornovanus]|uniref:Uncharacterized protein n=1 Tax=Olpidium bornovanus TaxID=278681 RepID=A0A8H7ZTW1_9FUNG|nr:MAG: hypothetical protein BJ554DRAFT_346 [Olpidium bornovanus]
MVSRVTQDTPVRRFGITARPTVPPSSPIAGAPPRRSSSRSGHVLFLHARLVKAATDEAFDVENGIRGVHGRLVLGGIANQAFLSGRSHSGAEIQRAHGRVSRSRQSRLVFPKNQYVYITGTPTGTGKSHVRRRSTVTLARGGGKEGPRAKPCHLTAHSARRAHLLIRDDLDAFGIRGPDRDAGVGGTEVDTNGAYKE